MILRDTATVFTREITPSLREPVSLLFEMGQPLFFLFIFGSLLPGGGDWQWFVPGILVMMCLMGPLGSGYHLLVELMSGSMERLTVTPLNRTALLAGRALKESSVLLAQAVLIVVLAVPLGFELHPLGILAGLALLVVLGLGLSSLSFVLAIKSAPSGTLFYVVSQLLIFPMLLLSGVLLPLDSGPAWLRAVGAANPLAHIVSAERALFAGSFQNLSILYGAAGATVFAIIGLVLGNRAMRRGLSGR
ncbi:ABC transporter permease [Nonomuraea sp. NPDC050310]|uniref:ABC transporter permease n=1 Tax=unclassified Nonomuraea TaxID=2593643 RepID=UPI0034086FB7